MPRRDDGGMQLPDTPQRGVARVRGHNAGGTRGRPRATRRPPAATACIAVALAIVLLTAAPAAHGRTVVRILDDAPLYATPGGPTVRAAGRAAVEHGTAWVLRREGDWLQIPTVLRRQSRGWIRRSVQRPLQQTRLLVRVDLSERRVVVSHGGRVLMRAAVGIGAPGSPSPVGVTSVSERIHVTSLSGLSARAYGPVVVALRMWQLAPSPGHPFGGIMAFHGSRDPASVGTASSAGCFRMRDADARRLARLVRAGTPVIIRP
jgi:lipoprotein-anchoring transpeptidase ErfK/SrfK